MGSGFAERASIRFSIVAIFFFFFFFLIGCVSVFDCLCILPRQDPATAALLSCNNSSVDEAVAILVTSIDDNPPAVEVRHHDCVSRLIDRGRRFVCGSGWVITTTNTTTTLWQAPVPDAVPKPTPTPPTIDTNILPNISDDTDDGTSPGNWRWSFWFRGKFHERITCH